jgi:hypothetical protein
MKYEVKIDERKYIIDAPNTYEAKVQAARQHFKISPGRFSSPNELLIKCKIEVNKTEEAP